MKKKKTQPTVFTVALVALSVLFLSAFLLAPKADFRRRMHVRGVVSVVAKEFGDFTTGMVTTTFYDDATSRPWKVTIRKSSWDSLLVNCKITNQRIAVAGYVNVNKPWTDTLYLDPPILHR